jgi:adenylate cyclase class IV
MPANIEIKARVRDLAALRARADALSDAPAQVSSQEDTFFNAPEVGSNSACLLPGVGS